MKKFQLLLLIAFCFLSILSFSQGKLTFSTPYGDNTAVGHFMQVNDIKMYYEIYGEGTPMVLIHGNGGSVNAMANQIEYFKTKYKVIVADSRGQGKSEEGKAKLTYEQITDDWAALLDGLHVDSAYLIGWSDGGIESLLMAIRHPNKVKMMAIMGANLQPDSSAVYPWAIKMVKGSDKYLDSMIAKKDTAYNYLLYKKLNDLLGKQPHIPLADVQRIAAPTLVLAGDKDVIREAHTLQIYQNLKKSWLCIFPGGTHMMPQTDPELFNVTVARFFSKPYYRPDTKLLFGVKE